jgi:hypothetical protein
MGSGSQSLQAKKALARYKAVKHGQARSPAVRVLTKES